LLADKKIENAVKDAMHYQEYLRKVRIKAAIWKYKKSFANLSGKSI